MKEYLKLANRISKEIKKGVPDYHTGLIGEQIIVASYQTMPLDKLCKMQFIISKIIKKKKEYLRVQEAKDNKLEEQENDNATTINSNSNNLPEV